MMRLIFQKHNYLSLIFISQNMHLHIHNSMFWFLIFIMFNRVSVIIYIPPKICVWKSSYKLTYCKNIPCVPNVLRIKLLMGTYSGLNIRIKFNIFLFVFMILSPYLLFFPPYNRFNNHFFFKFFSAHKWCHIF